MGDCTIRAISIARAISYEEAQSLVNSWDTVGGGNAIHNFNAMIVRQDWAEQVSPGDVRGLSVREFCRRHKRGRFIVTVSRHAFAVIKGRPMDKSINRHNRNVLSAWRITRVPKGKGVPYRNE